MWSRGRTISLVRFLMLLNYIIIIFKSKIKDGPARFSAAVFALFSRGVKWHSFVEKYRFVLTRATRQVPHVEQDLLNHLRSPPGRVLVAQSLVFYGGCCIRLFVFLSFLVIWHGIFCCFFFTCKFECPFCLVISPLFFQVTANFFLISPWIANKIQSLIIQTLIGYFGHEFPIWCLIICEVSGNWFPRRAVGLSIFAMVNGSF